MDVRAHLPLEELVRLERGEKDAAQSKRLRIIILAIGGWTAPAIAMSVGLSRRICQRWVYRYNEFGLAGLSDRRGHEPQSLLTPEQQAQVCQRLEAGPRPEDQVCSLRGVDMQRILATEFGVVYSLSAVYQLLHKLGYSYLVPRPRHRQANPAAQEQFKHDVPARLQALRDQHAGKRLRVYFQDEARFGQQGTTTNLWAKRGSRPTAVRQTEYQYLGSRRSLSGDGTGRRSAQSAVNYEDRQHLPAAVFANTGRRRTCRADLGRRWIPRQRQVANGSQRHDLATPGVQPRTQSDREFVALPEEPLLVESSLRRLRRTGTRRHPCLASRRARPGIDENRVRRAVCGRTR